MRTRATPGRGENMNRPGPRTVFWLVLAVALLGLTSACNRLPERPNIVLILADDLAWNQLSCYGSSFYETPHLDALARQGMRFTDAYAASPICSPTRASIMTGKHPARLRVTQFISPGDYAEDAIKLLEPVWTRRLPLEEETVAEALKDSGYVTAAFGKWHLSQAKTPPGSLPFNPDKQGFDEHFVTYKPVPRMAREWQTPENDAHNVRFITDRSLEFMEKNRERPFFLFVSHNSVHTPLVEKEALISKYRAKPDADAPTNHPVIGAMIETLDLSVGRLLAKLDELDLSERTLVLFFSDNGGLEWSGDEGQVPANHPLRAGKGDLYEGGIRVPLIARWPAVVAAGSVVEEPVSSVDLFPTFVEAAGGADKHDEIDGVSLLPLLRGAASLDRDALFWHYPHYHGSGALPSSAVRKGRFKLLEWHEERIFGLENRYELFDLTGDLGETTDLASSRPEKTRELAADLENWRNSVGAQMPRRHPDYRSAGGPDTPRKD